MAQKKILDHGVKLKRRKAKAISDSAAMARSLLRHKLHQFRESIEMKSKSENIVTDSHSMENLELPKPNTSPGWSISSRTTKLVNGGYNSTIFSYHFCFLKQHRFLKMGIFYDKICNIGRTS